jgi:hypothetical protein
MLRSEVRFFLAPLDSPWSERFALKTSSGGFDSIARPARTRVNRRPSRVAIAGSGNLRVETESHLRTGVSEPCLNGLHVDTLGHQVGSRQAAEVVEGEAREARLNACWCPGALAEVGVLKITAILTDEDPDVGIGDGEPPPGKVSRHHRVHVLATPDRYPPFGVSPRSSGGNQRPTIRTRGRARERLPIRVLSSHSVSMARQLLRRW